LLRQSGEEGFTLLEVVIALSVLVIAIMGVVAAVVTSLKAGSVARERTVALAAAQQELEELIAASEVEILNAHNDPFTVDGLTQRPDGTPLGQITIDSTEAPLYKIEVMVRWVGAYGNEQLSLDTTVLP
jgi:type II secretion system protein I